MENLKEALQYIAKLGVEAEKTEVLEVCGRTYATKSLTRYDEAPKASPLTSHTLTSLMDYIRDCSGEFSGNMILHVVSPTKVQLISELDQERERETLFETTAETSEFRFGQWYDQEMFLISLQANFEPSVDLEVVMKVAGNVEKVASANYTDDGVTQVATINQGIASKADAIVPNPVELVPYRTFQEVRQPASKFVFRIGDKQEPAFKIVEAEGGIWRNEAIHNIKAYIEGRLEGMSQAIRESVIVIG